MHVYRWLYYSTLVGALAGLSAWTAHLLLSIPLSESGSPWLPDSLVLLVFGALLGPVLYAYFDRALTGRVRFRPIGFGLLHGIGAAIVASLIVFALRRGVSGGSPMLYRVASWSLGISVIALGVGLRWVHSNRARVLHTYAGGLVGGLIGGVVFVLFIPHLPAGTELASLLFAGAGSGFGAGIAPVLLREGRVRFISSGDARAHNKLGKVRKVWELEPGESYIVGSMMTATGGTRFQQGADLYIPDASIAPRHAVVFSKEGRFFIARHPDASGQDGISRFVLRIKGKTVVTSQELHPADDVLIGRTALRFESQKSGD